MSEPERQKLVETIPPADAVRQRLAQAMRDVQLLRQLLKLAQRIEKDHSTASTGAGYGR